MTKENKIAQIKYLIRYALGKEQAKEFADEDIELSDAILGRNENVPAQSYLENINEFLLDFYIQETDIIDKFAEFLYEKIYSNRENGKPKPLLPIFDEQNNNITNKLLWDCFKSYYNKLKNEEEFGLSEKTLKRIRNYFRAFPEIEEVKIYGSRAKGNYQPGSDIDFAVFGECEDIIGELLSGLDALPTPYKYDVTDYKALTHEGLKEHIDRVGKTFYKKGNDNG